MADDTVSWKMMYLTLVEPWYFMFLACTFLPGTVHDLIQRGESHKLLNWSAFKDAWFAVVWAFFGPMFAQGGNPIVAPLVAKAEGVVLDIGPGSGDRVCLFKSEKETKMKITKIFGIEPNTVLHAKLREKVKEADLVDVYEIIAIGVQDLGLSELGVEGQSVDTIVTVQSLCSVPQPELRVKELYGLLKPGGKWIMSEHVRTHKTGWISWYQALINIFWPHFFHGCSLTIPTDEMILNVGNWENVQMNKPNPNRYLTCPGTSGIFTKKSA